MRDKLLVFIQWCLIKFVVTFHTFLFRYLAFRLLEFSIYRAEFTKKKSEQDINISIVFEIPKKKYSKLKYKKKLLLNVKIRNILLMC